jgi:hypothetical protein
MFYHSLVSFTFTVLLVHVLHVQHPLALEGSTAYARVLVHRFFTKYTRIDLKEIEPHIHNFRNLIASSRLKVAFEGRPRGYKTSNYKIYK